MLSTAVYIKVACGLACVSPGDQRDLVKWDQAKVEGGPCWVISLLGSGITSVASVGGLGGSWVSVKRVLVDGEWVSPPSNSLLGGCNPICGAPSD